MLTMKQGMKLSAVIDRLDLVINNPEGTQEQIGGDLFLQIVRKAHRAEHEIYALIAEVKKVSLEEAENVDMLEFVKELMSNPRVRDFFTSAVKSGGQG